MSRTYLKTHFTTIVSALTLLAAAISALEYGEICNITDFPDLCDTKNYQHCGTTGLCECKDSPNTWYDKGERVCKLLSSSGCIKAQNSQQCVPNAICPEVVGPSQCVCEYPYDQNSGRLCYLPYYANCSNFGDYSNCDPAGFLECGTINNGNKCICQNGPDDAWYDSITKTCHILAGVDCKLTNESQPCVLNSECDGDQRICKCLNNFEPTEQRMCTLNYGQQCDNNIDLCNHNAYMSCSKRVCSCRPVYESMYDPRTKICRLLNGAGCSISEGSQRCIDNAECIPAEGAEARRCKCQYNLQPNKNRECFLVYDQPCDTSIELCDPAGYLTCGASSRCECKDPKSVYDPELKECRYGLNVTCSPAAEAQNCGLNAYCDQGICRCSTNFEGSGNGDCLRRYGAPCSLSAECNGKNMLECVSQKCVCRPGYLESMSGATQYDIECLPGYQQVCLGGGLPCNSEAMLRCSEVGRCECLSPGEQIYQGDIRRCGTLVGNRCRPSIDNSTNECVKNAFCSTYSSTDVFGTCNCEFKLIVNLKGQCVSRGISKEFSGLFLMTLLLLPKLL